jgi:hypothetical protein
MGFRGFFFACLPKHFFQKASACWFQNRIIREKQKTPKRRKGGKKMDQEKKDEHQLSMEDLDQVAGGKQREDREIFKAIQLNKQFRAVLYKNYGTNNLKG